jgi:thioredoxin 1
LTKNPSRVKVATGRAVDGALRPHRRRTTMIRVKHAFTGIAAALLLSSIACERSSAQSPALTASGEAKAPRATQRVPRLVDVGAGKCIPCKAMAPILQELRAQYAGRMEVVFVDVWEDPDAGQPYGIRMIPTQIFYGRDGRELARHEGFMSKEEILAQWRALGLGF